MVGRVLGYGKGNWGGRGGRRSEYSTDFDHLVGLLLNDRDDRPRDYERTYRGIQYALGLDAETFHRFRTGTTKPEKVVIAHMNALLYRNYDQVPSPVYWDYVKSFSIKRVRRKMEDTETVEDALEVELNGVMMESRKLSLSTNRRVREMIFDLFEIITPPLKRGEWADIFEEAMNGTFTGSRSNFYEEATERMERNRRRKADLFGDLDSGKWGPR